LAGAQQVSLFEKLQSHMYVVFGGRIPLKTLCHVLGFSSIDALRRAIRNELPLTIYSDPSNGERYVLTDELIKLLAARYQRAASSNLN